MNKEIDLLKRRFEREKNARIEAEKLLEGKSLELYTANNKLMHVNDQLEVLVEDRTEKLKNSEALYQSLVESISDLICKTKLNGEITFVNPVTAKTLGYEMNEIIGKNIFDFVAPSHRRTAFYFITRQFLNRICVSYKEFPLITKEGNEIWLGNNIQFYEPKCRTCDVKQCFLAGISQKISTTQCVYEEIIIVARDITLKKQAEETNAQQSEQLEKFLNHQLVISEIALDLNLIGDFKTKLNSVIATIGEHLDVSRVYIFENSSDQITTTNAHEWCNINITPQIDHLQDIPYRKIPSWKKILTEEGILFAENINDLPPDIRIALEPQNIKSIIVLPIQISNNFFGFVGFDECIKIRHWEIGEIELLKTISNIISNAYERKISEDNLRISEQKNQAIIDSIPDFIFITDKDNRVKLFKKSSLTPTNFAPDYYIGKTMTELFEMSFANQIEIALGECRKNSHFQYDYQHTIKGILRSFEARMSVMNNEDIISMVRDVSEIKEKEEQLKIAKEVAENASRSKSEFLANVSHEIRTPMNAILGFSEILLDKIEQPQYKNHLKTILSSGRTLLSLINDILDLSKIEAGKLEVEFEPIHYNTVVNEIEQVFTPKIQQKGLLLEMITHLDVPEYLYMDEIRFHQILFNLIGNAIKFTKKGFIRLETSMEPTEQNDKINLIIELEDTGIGIPENQQDSIFQAFTQQSGQSNRNYEGTGLGLTITQRLISKMNGTISVKSEVGKGSIFKIVLNDVQIADISGVHQNTVEYSDNAIKFEPATIMVVDDIDYNIQVVKNILDYEEFTFIEATSGEECLIMLEVEKPDIIFMDIRMPGITGISATEIIKANPKFPQMPIIAFTASVMQDQIDLITTLFDGYLRKPVSKKQFIQTLKEHLKYSVVEQNNQEENEAEHNNQPDQNCLDNLPELIADINKQIIEQWENICGSLVIFEIEDFRDHLSDINQKYQCNLLNKYIDDLNESIQSFDIELIENTVMKFKDIFEQLNQYLHE